MSDNKTKQNNSSSIAEKLKNVRVGIRSDLEVVRHVFNGVPAYIIRDPLTFQSFKLDINGYKIFTSIERHKPLGKIFNELVSKGILNKNDEEKFYKLIFTLHALNFLNLPVSNDKILYKRYLAKKRAKLKSKILGIMFLQVPLFNPDSFLNATIRYVDFLFTRWFFAIWLLVVGLATGLIIKDWDKFFGSIHNVLAFKYVFYIWAILILLKVFHEFGHAYACKHFGGCVPEMGAFFVMFTPLAYVNATASWSFARKRDRIIVALGGMYVELIFAAIALFVWYFTHPGFVHDIAYYVVFIAGIATLLFNLNPLARFDGYYVLSDFLEIPNLRANSAKFIAGIFKRILLGIKDNNLYVPFKIKVILLLFGIASIIYRTTLIFAIGLTAAWKFAGFGILLACMLLLSYFGTKIVRLAKYLLYSEETQPVRLRSISLAILLFVVSPIIMLTVPFPNKIMPAGVVLSSNEYPVCARVDGFIRRVNIKPGQKVRAGMILARLENDSCIENLIRAETNYKVSNIRYEAFKSIDSAKAVQEYEKLKASLSELNRRKEDVSFLTVSSPADGVILKSLSNSDIGRYVRKGSIIALIGDNKWRIQAVLSEQDFSAIRPKVGDEVRIRVLANPSITFKGQLCRIVPCGTNEIDADKLNLTELGGGDIAVDTKTQKTKESYFDITITLIDNSKAHWLKSGMTCRISYAAHPETIGSKLYKKFSLAMHKILQVR